MIETLRLKCYSAQTSLSQKENFQSVPLVHRQIPAGF